VNRFTPRITPVRAVLLREDLNVKRGHYLLISDDDVVTSMPAAQFEAVYAPEDGTVIKRKRKSRAKAAKAAPMRPRPGTARHKVLAFLEKQEGWFTANELQEILPDDCKKDTASVLSYLAKTKQIRSDAQKGEDGSGPTVYAPLNHS